MDQARTSKVYKDNLPQILSPLSELVTPPGSEGPIAESIWRPYNARTTVGVINWPEEAGKHWVDERLKPIQKKFLSLIAISI